MYCEQIHANVLRTENHYMVVHAYLRLGTSLELLHLLLALTLAHGLQQYNTRSIYVYDQCHNTDAICIYWGNSDSSGT